MLQKANAIAGLKYPRTGINEFSFVQTKFCRFKMIVFTTRRIPAEQGWSRRDFLLISCNVIEWLTDADARTNIDIFGPPYTKSPCGAILQFFIDRVWSILSTTKVFIWPSCWKHISRRLWWMIRIMKSKAELIFLVILTRYSMIRGFFIRFNNWAFEIA